MPCYAIVHNIIQYDLTCQIISYNIIYHITSYHIYHIPYPTIPNLPYRTVSYPILSYPILSYPTLPCLILPYPTISYPIPSHPIPSHHITYHITSHYITSYHIIYIIIHCLHMTENFRMFELSGPWMMYLVVCRDKFELTGAVKPFLYIEYINLAAGEHSSRTTMEYVRWMIIWTIP